MIAKKGRCPVTLPWQDYIEEKPGVMLGKPVFKGSRLTVEHVLSELGTGMSESDLLNGYPQLNHDHLRTAMLYAAAVRMMYGTSQARWEILRRVEVFRRKRRAK